MGLDYVWKCKEGILKCIVKVKINSGIKNKQNLSSSRPFNTSKNYNKYIKKYLIDFHDKIFTKIISQHPEPLQN